MWPRKGVHVQSVDEAGSLHGGDERGKVRNGRRKLDNVLGALSGAHRHGGRENDGLEHGDVCERSWTW